MRRATRSKIGRRDLPFAAAHRIFFRVVFSRAVPERICLPGIGKKKSKNGGRGFGFTGGHKHQNWGNDNYRKAVLNGLLWIAKAKVPKNGVPSTVTAEELKQNLDPK